MTLYKLSLGKGNSSFFSSNKGPGPLQRGDNYKNIKIGWVLLKIFFSRTTWPILTRLGTNHTWERGFKFLQMKVIDPL
jgi:hypothetical protein